MTSLRFLWRSLTGRERAAVAVTTLIAFAATASTLPPVWQAILAGTAILGCWEVVTGARWRNAYEREVEVSEALKETLRLRNRQRPDQAHLS